MLQHVNKSSSSDPPHPHKKYYYTLCEYKDEDGEDEYGVDACMYPIPRYHLDLSIILDKTDEEIKNTSVKDVMWMPINLACIYIERGFDVNQRDTDGNTLLILYCKYRMRNQICHIIYYKPDIIFMNNDGKSCFNYIFKYWFNDHDTLLMIRTLLSFDHDGSVLKRKYNSGYGEMTLPEQIIWERNNSLEWSYRQEEYLQFYDSVLRLFDRHLFLKCTLFMIMWEETDFEISNKKQRVY